MTQLTTTTRGTLPISRRTVLKTAGVSLGALTLGTVGLRAATGVASGVTPIETCGGNLDVVLALDYSGSIRSAGTWNDIQGGVESFLEVVPEDVQLGLVLFGDSPVAFEYGTGNLLDFATAANVTALKAGVPASAPPQENATHMPGALTFADAILENEGRDGREIIVLITDGGPNYENGFVGNGDDDPVASGFQGPDDDVTFAYGSFEFTGGSNGGENGVAGEAGELTETTATATSIKDGGRRIIAVGVGGNVAGFDDYLRDDIASSPDDFVVTEASNLGSELETLLSEVCDECVECPFDGEVKFEYDEESDSFVMEGDHTVDLTYVSYETKEGEMYEPMSVTFDTEYCDLYVLVKSGQELEVQSFTDLDGSVTVETANDEKYAISFVAFYCTEQAAHDAYDAWTERMSRGRGRGR